MRIEPDPFESACEQSSILPGRHAAIAITAAAEEELPWLLPAGLDVLVHRLTGLFGESNRTGRPVFFWRTVARSTA
jgi:hypothetical protein